MVNLSKALIELKEMNVLVVGDFMLDKYTKGTIKRISPEAPVSVLHAEQEEYLPGGAGNVAINLQALNAHVSVLGRIGSDPMGEKLQESFQNVNIQTTYLWEQENYPTPVKNRFLATSQQVLRVDYENLTPLSNDLERKIIQNLPQILSGVHIVAVSDYNKGFLTLKLLKSLIDFARKRSIPVIVDPKSIDFTKYQNATLIKPNLKEAYVAANEELSIPIDQVAEKLLHQSKADHLLITRSEKGMSLFEKGKRTDFAVRAKEVVDVTGAGDTVLALLCMGIASGLKIEESIELSNIAASIAIERIGCAKITIKDLAKRILQEDVDCKIFDESHLYALTQVLKHEPFSLVTIDQVNGISTELYRFLRKLKSQNNQKLVVHIQHAKFSQEFLSLLASLHEINYMIIEERALSKLLEVVKPQEIHNLVETDLQSV